MTILKRISANLPLLSILVVAALLRLYKLDFQNAWLDEIHTLKESDPLLTFSQFHKVIMFREGIPHFYFLIIHFLAYLFGPSIFIARLVSAVAGILSVLYIYKLGKELVDKSTGYIAALLLTVNVFQIEYSQEARSYSLMMLFIVIAYYYLVLFLKNQNYKTAILLGLFSGLITNAHPIGLLSVASIYLTVGLFLFLEESSNRKKYFGFAFLSGCIALLVFSPVYQIVAKVSDIKDFWVAAPTFEGIKNVFIDLSGKSVFALYALVVSIVIGLLSIILKAKNDLSKSKQLGTTFAILIIWLFFYAGILIVKSYNGPSLILQRYFSGIVPVITLLIAFSIDLITNNYLKKGIVIAFIGILLYPFVYPNYYYSTVTKAQFSTVCEAVLKKNTNNERIVTNWGWLLSYYLDRENKLNNILEVNLENYLAQVKDNALDEESFWYIDGNSRPYAVSKELEEFIAQHYSVDQSFQYYDTWAKHFISNKKIATDEITFKLSNFTNAQFDGMGKLMFFENSLKKYKEIVLAKGNYEIQLIGNSTPLKPIDNENAKMNILINNVIFKTITLSEIPNTKVNLKYKQETTGTFNFGLAFINDYSNNNQDRNIQISSLKIKKIL